MATMSTQWAKLSGGFEAPDPLAPVWRSWYNDQIRAPKIRAPNNDLKTMIVGSLRIGLGPLSFRVLHLLKSDEK